MIPPMPKKSSSTEENRIYIEALAEIVNRKVNTLRRWDNDDRLPAHLKPKRGARNRRYWTHAQVYGSRGIIAWMKKNDIRPGNLVTSPDKEAEHIKNLRQPKFLSGHHINSAKAFADKGKSREWIIKKLLPRTRYTRPENLERALLQVFEANGWKFPEPKPKKELSKRKLKEIEILERKIKNIIKQSTTETSQ